MSSIGDYIIPGLMVLILFHGIWNDVPVFETFMAGAKEGITTSLRIIPSLVALMTAVGMFKASGALDLISFALAPAAAVLQLPEELLPLALLRPISGSGAMAIFQDVLATYGPDSFIGRVASVLEGSSETTFYTIAVYFGATKINNTRHAMPASLTADLAGFLMSGICVRLML